MILQDNTIYRDGNGYLVTIMGATANDSTLMWSLQGDWYERATGRFIWVDRKGDMTTHEDNGHNVVKHVD